MDGEASFEANLRQLEKAVKALESGELGLDAALAQYEGGIRLLASCHAMLDAAGKKVSLLTGASEDGAPETAEFDASATFDGPEPPRAARLDWRRPRVAVVTIEGCGQGQSSTGNEFRALDPMLVPVPVRLPTFRWRPQASRPAQGGQAPRRRTAPRFWRS